MNKAKSTKRALLSALLALVMTVSMLVGTTFAWFTDSVTSSGNKIVAGNLDVKLHMYDASQGKYVDISDSEKPIFGEGGLIDASEDVSTLWEPGKTQVVYLAIENAGSLSLQYKVALNVTEITKDLNLALSYVITPDARADVADKKVEAWDGANALGVVAGEQLVSNGSVAMKPDSIHYFALSVHMDELAGNEYKDGSITFDLAVLASQLGDHEFAEDDSFGNDYDAGALFPGHSEYNPLGTEDITLTTEGDNTATVTLPAELVSSLPSSVTEVSLKSFSTEVEADANGDAVVNIKSLELYDQDGGIINLEGNTEVISVKLYVGTEFAGKYAVVAHDGVNVASAQVDSEGYVNYNATHFCDVTIELTAEKPEIPGMGDIEAPDVGEDGEVIPEDLYELVTVLFGNTFYTVSRGMANSWHTLSNAEQIVADIYCPEDLIAYSMMYKNGDITAETGVHTDLTIKADLDFADYSWAPIGRFFTNIHGEDHVISNLSDSFFGCVYDVQLDNITIMNVKASGSASGVLAKELAGDVYFTNVTIAGENTVTYVKDNAQNWPEEGVGVGAICGVSLIGYTGHGKVDVTVDGKIDVYYNGAFFTNYTNLENLSVSKEFGLNLYKPNANTTVTLTENGAISALGTYYIFDAADLEDDFAYDIASKQYYVLSAAGLAAFAAEVNAGNNFSGKTVALFRDIDLENIAWTPIGNSSNAFSGTFDGKGYTVSNLNAVAPGKSNIGLFGMTTNGKVMNLTVENAIVTGRLNVGVVAGTPYTSKYENITVIGHVEVNGMAYVGGVGGKNAYANWNNITVDVDESSYVNADSVEGGVAYRTYVGGVIGFAGEGGHTFSNITSNIDVIGSTCDVGGIIGIAHYGNNFVNVSCSADVTLTGAADAADAEEIGGIAGVWMNSGSNVTLTNCKFTGTLTSNITEGVDLSNNTLVGKGYNANGTNVLIIDGIYYVSNAEKLVESLEAGKSVALVNDIKIDPANMSNSYGATGINVKLGQTIDGCGNTLDIKGAGGTWDSGISTTGGVIKNITITGSFRGVFVNHNSTKSSTVVLENVIIDGTTYTISCDQGMNQNVVATGSTFNGWTSYATTVGNVEFNGCSFGEGSGYAFLRPYAPTVFEDCDFEAGYLMDPRAEVSFINCRLNGVLITAENVGELVYQNSQNIKEIK